MVSLNGFDATKEEEWQGELGAVPAGRYFVKIIEASIEQTKKANGEYLKLVFEIIDGQFSGRKLFTNLNLKNHSQQAVAIARAELAAVCKATGVYQPNDTDDLMGIPIWVTVKVRDHEGKQFNNITKYEPKDSGEPTGMTGKEQDTANASGQGGKWF